MVDLRGKSTNMPRTPIVDEEANGMITSPRRKQPPQPYQMPTPVSNSPSTKHSPTSTTTRLPPAFLSTSTSTTPGHVHIPSQSFHTRPHSEAAGTSFSCPTSLGMGRLYSGAMTSASGARYAQFAPRSPYRPGEYGRREYAMQHSHAAHAGMSDRTEVGKGRVGMILGPGIERRLFEDSEEEEEVPKRNRGSSPLQPPFEARLMLRKGASVDIISWLRKNFHHIPSPSHTNLTPSTSLLAIRALIAERFPRQPEPEELVKAVTVAFPRSQWDYPSNSSEPPMIRGLVWNGKELYDDTTVARELERKKQKEIERSTEREREREQRQGQRHDSNGNTDTDFTRHLMQTPERKGRKRVETKPMAGLASINTGVGAIGGINGNGISNGNGSAAGPSSRSPTQSTLMSPTSSSKRPPNTPARSVLDDFAELATLADKSPKSKAHSLPGEVVAPAPAYALANICNLMDQPVSPDVATGGPGGMGVSEKARKRADLLLEPVGAFGLGMGVESVGLGMGLGGGMGLSSRKRRAEDDDALVDGRRGRGRGASPDRLTGLLAAAAATAEGSGMGMGMGMGMEGERMGHKRRRTIGGTGPGGMRDIMRGPERDLADWGMPPRSFDRSFDHDDEYGYGRGRGNANANGNASGGAQSLSYSHSHDQTNPSLGLSSAWNGRSRGGNSASPALGWNRDRALDRDMDRNTGLPLMGLASLPEMPSSSGDLDVDVEEEEEEVRPEASKVDAKGKTGGEGGKKRSRARALKAGNGKGRGNANSSSNSNFNAVARARANVNVTSTAIPPDAASTSSGAASQGSSSAVSASVPALPNGRMWINGDETLAGDGNGDGMDVPPSYAAATAGTSASAALGKTNGAVGSSGGRVIAPAPIGQFANDGSDTLTDTTTLPTSASTTTTTTGITGTMGTATITRVKPPRARKANELPTEGDAPGIDCKPPHPYHEMIRHAIQHSPDGRLQLSQIYASIAERFPFFKTLDEKKTAGWQNSIRHNLSLKKMFVRVNKIDGPTTASTSTTPAPATTAAPTTAAAAAQAMAQDDAGKGGWWTVQLGIPDEGRPGRKVRGATSGAGATAAGVAAVAVASSGAGLGTGGGVAMAG